MKIKILMISAVVLAALVLFGFNYAVKHVLPYSPIRPVRCSADSFLTPKVAGLKWEPFNITVSDSIKLIGWFIHSSTEPAKGTIFVLHGIGSCKAGMLTTAKLLADSGYNCVLYDSRASGESGGINCTYGFYEKYDLSAYIDSTIERYPCSGPYGILGHSMGAAVSLQALERDKRIKCGVAMSPFANLKQIVRDYFTRAAFKMDYIPDKALTESEKIASFSVDSVSPVHSAKNIIQPVMIIHGTNDNNIPARYGKEIYDNLHSDRKEWYPVPGASHNNIPVKGGEEWKRRLIAFFDKNLSEHK
jgi:dipeptidyl aminopeptidase/acylaminoacyl peptidase